MSYMRTLYWANTGSGKIGRMYPDGIPNQDFIDCGPAPMTVAVNSRFIYWATAAGTIGRANLDGTDVRPSIVTNLPKPVLCLAASEQAIYWGNNPDTAPGQFNTASIGRAGIDGSEANPLFIAHLSNVNSVVVDDDYIYWTSPGMFAGTPATGAVGRAAIAGSHVNPTLISGHGINPSAVAVTKQSMFISLDKGIAKANLNGTNLHLDFISGLSAGQLAANDSHIYWISKSTIGRANVDGTGITQAYVANASSPYGLTTAQVASVVPPIEHVFVLMLENRSFDHLLGGLGLSGFDAQTRQPTTANGPNPEVNYNLLDGKRYPVSTHAPDPMPTDLPHEWPDTIEQLATYDGVSNGGFVERYAKLLRSKGLETSPGDVMANFAPSQLPTLSKLAAEFAVCDNWFASVPGPTLPNRLFAMCGSSGGLDYSPSIPKLILWATLDGLVLPNGSIFDRLKSSGKSGQVFIDGPPYSILGQFATACLLHGVSLCDAGVVGGTDRTSLEANTLQQRLELGSRPSLFWIEPNYGFNWLNGQSQHPTDTLANGEKLIATVYNALLNSDLWNKSVLIITYDEYGGFYDHVPPPAATPPGDGHTKGIEFGHGFDQYGPRVPAVIVSPYIAKNTIDHGLYDHTSILRTIEDMCGLQPMTNRDRNARSLAGMMTFLDQPRTDCRELLVPPAAASAPRSEPEISEDDPLPQDGLMNALVVVAAKTELELAGDNPTRKRGITTQVDDISTLGEAQDYLTSVAAMLQKRRSQS